MTPVAYRTSEPLAQVPIYLNKPSIALVSELGRRNVVF